MLPGQVLTLVSSLSVFLLAIPTVFPAACSAKNTLPTFSRVSYVLCLEERRVQQCVYGVCKVIRSKKARNKIGSFFSPKYFLISDRDALYLMLS